MIGIVLVSTPNQISLASEVAITMEEETENEKETISYFEQAMETTDEIIEKKDYKKKIKTAFYDICDFIFYNKEINDVTFDELSDKGKQKVLNILFAIDEKIESNFSDYKTIIKSRYENISTDIKDKLKAVNKKTDEFLREKIENDTYESVKKAGSEMIEYGEKALKTTGKAAKKSYKKVKKLVSSWYNNNRD